MNPSTLSPEDRLLPLLDRLRRLDIDLPPPDGARISPSQAALLSAVAASPGAGLQAIAQDMGLAPPTVSVAVSRLEGAGLLARLPDPQDGRAIRLYLTERGEAVYRRALESRRQRASHLLAPLSLEERHLLVDLLDRATAHVGVPSRDDGTKTGRQGLAAGLLRRLRDLWAPSGRARVPR